MDSQKVNISQKGYQNPRKCSLKIPPETIADVKGTSMRCRLTVRKNYGFTSSVKTRPQVQMIDIKAS